MAKRYDVGLTNNVLRNTVLLYVTVVFLHEKVKSRPDYFPNNVTISNNILKVGTKYDWYEKV